MHAQPFDATAKVYIAGHTGLVGAALMRTLEARGFGNLLTIPRVALDLRDAAAVDAFFAAERPQYVILAAAKVGGIAANSAAPADFLQDNLQIQTNVIQAAWRHTATKLLFLGSSCIYPRDCPQPIKEEYLLTGPLEATNEWYAIAKIAGIKLCQAYRQQYGFDAISVMPTNLYGPHDNFDLTTAHVLPALLRKAHEAKLSGARSMTVWGSGAPRRELLHVDDLANACVALIASYSDAAPINVGTGEDVSIRELAELVAQIVGFNGALEFDTAKPDGTPRKVLDVQRIKALGWSPEVPLADGIRSTYEWFCSCP